jgi:hypothetical protein
MAAPNATCIRAKPPGTRGLAQDLVVLAQPPVLCLEPKSGPTPAATGLPNSKHPLRTSSRFAARVHPL